MNYVDDLIAGVQVTFGHVVNDPRATPAVSDFAANQRLEIATSALDDAVQINPLTGLMNVYVLVRLSRRELDRPSFEPLLGDDVGAIRDFMRQEETDLRGLISKYLNVSQQEQLEAEIAKWIEENPDDHSVTHVNLVDFNLASDATSTTSGSIFDLLRIDPLSDIDPAVREVAQTREIAERLFFYTQHASVILSWRAEYLYQRMLAAPQVAKLQTNVDSLNETAKHFASLGDRLTEVAEHLPINKFTAIDQAQLSAVQTGNVLLQQATTRVSAEREASLQQVSQLLQNQQAAATDNASKVVTLAVSYMRAVVFAAAAFLIGGLLLVVVVHHWLSSRRLRLKETISRA